MEDQNELAAQNANKTSYLQKKKNIFNKIAYRSGKKINADIVRVQSGDIHLRKYVDHFRELAPELPKFSQFIENIYSSDLRVQHQGLVGLRKILSIEQDTSIQKAVDAKIIPKLIEFLCLENLPDLQFEAAWAMSNIACGTTEQTEQIVTRGAIRHFVKLLKSPRGEISEQAVWALGNISGDSSELRDLILRSGGLFPLLQIVDHAKTQTLIKHGTWAISNLARGRPLPDINLVRISAPTLCNVIKKDTDTDTLTDGIWALSYITKDELSIKMVLGSGVVPALVHYMGNQFLPIVIPSLRTLGNLMTGTEEQTDLILCIPDFMKNINVLLEHTKKAVRREACWCLSNIAAGNSLQIAIIINYPGCINRLMSLGFNDVPEIKREALWVLSNIMKNGTLEQIVYLLDIGVFLLFAESMDSRNDKAIVVVLQRMINILGRDARPVPQNISDHIYHKLQILIESAVTEELFDKAKELLNLSKKRFPKMDS